MAGILCLATVLPQQGKLSFGYQDLVSSPQTALKRPKRQEDKTIFKNRLKGFQRAIKRENRPLQSLSGRDRAEKHVAGLL